VSHIHCSLFVMDWAANIQVSNHGEARDIGAARRKKSRGEVHGAGVKGLDARK
jgi:hypothetical protein